MNFTRRLFVLIQFSCSLVVCATASAAEHTLAPIDTCFHWLKNEYLAKKIEHAEKNAGALYFHAGPIYCWRSPLGAHAPAFEDYGDRLIRIKFKPEFTKTIDQVRARETSTIHMDESKKPIHYYSREEWQEYYFSPSAVESWSVYQPRTLEEMRAELEFYRSGKVQENDLHYPFWVFAAGGWQGRLTNVIEKIAEKGKNQARIFGAFVERHFETQYEFPWRKFIVPVRSR